MMSRDLIVAADPEHPNMIVFRLDCRRQRSLKLISSLLESFDSIDYYHHKEQYNIQKMVAVLDPHFKYLESHHQEFDKLVTEALASNNPIVQQAALA